MHLSFHIIITQNFNETPTTTKTIHANDPYEFRSILLSARRKSKLISADVV